MNAATTIRLVAARELRSRVTTKANIVASIAMLVLIVGGVFAISVFTRDDGEPPTVRIGVDDQAAATRPYLEAAAANYGVSVDVVDATEQAARDGFVGADTAPETGPLDAFVGGPTTERLVLGANPGASTVLSIVADALRALALDDAVRAAGGDPATLQESLSQAQPTFEFPGQDQDERYGPAYGLAMVALILLLIALITGCQQIAMGVVEEKSSRVVEILLATARPTHLLAGKVLGVGAFSLAQIVVLAGSLLGSLYAFGIVDRVEINAGPTLAVALVWFLIGYATFSILFGAFASLVSRVEDVGAVTTPLTFLVVIPYYAAVFLVPQQPDSTLVHVLSQVPFFAPFMMTMRSAFGNVAGWEMALAIGLALALIPALIWLSARLYERGVLHSGGRLGMREALRRNR